jgi:anaerobic magnesium-protoporphyrin IX monomethyl ester cyclase
LRGLTAGILNREKNCGKSDERVMKELAILKGLGVTHVYIEDDMFLGKKQRALRLLRNIREAGMAISDVNGVNVVHMFCRGATRRYEVDGAILDALKEAGFQEVVLAFESAVPRVLRKYATNKWDPDRMPIDELIQGCKARGLAVGGNYMLGYPDETRGEMQSTIALARRHKEAGIDWANFFSVMPLPGTPLFEMAIREGTFPRNFNPDYMDWTKANFVHTVVPAAEVAELRQRAWEELNSKEFQENKIAMVQS